MRCSACNNPMSYRKKKPVTTFGGQMNSIYEGSFAVPDKIPSGEYEDLCDTCIDVIKHYNYDFSGHNIGITQREDKEFHMNTDEYFEDNTLSGEYEVTEAIYQGYRDHGL